MAIGFKGSDESDDRHERSSRRNGPILHTPKAGNPLLKLIIPVGVIIVLAIAGYYYYQYRSQAQAPPPAIVTLSQPDSTQRVDQLLPQDSAAFAAQPPVEEAHPEVVPASKTAKEQPKTVSTPPAERESEQPAAPARTEPRPAKNPPREAMQSPKPDFATSSGKYVIYVGSFKSKQSAEMIEGRWREAGYPTHLTHSRGWYRVSIGNYPTKEEGKRVAEIMRDAFEYGYFVDVLQ